MTVLPPEAHWQALLVQGAQPGLGDIVYQIER